MNNNFTQSIITQRDGYVTIMTITKDFVIVEREGLEIRQQWQKKNL
jgi:hypothetical protein